MAKLNHDLAKVVIRNLDDHTDLVAHYNPKEISLDRSVPWAPHPVSLANTHILEFTNSPPMSLGCELFCDVYEQKGNVDKVFIDPLLDLTRARPMKAGGIRPPICLFIWGGKFRRFRGVVESLAVKYTMFLADGTPCRATATVKMKFAGLVSYKDKNGSKRILRAGGSNDFSDDVPRGDPSGGTHGFDSMR